MIRDVQRGWAWTRALLGLKAKEIHLCGEESAVHLIDSILCTTNEDLEVSSEVMCVFTALILIC